MITVTRYAKRYGHLPTQDYVCDTRTEAQSGMPSDAPVGSTVQCGEDGSVWRKFPTGGWKELPEGTSPGTWTAAALVCGGMFLQA